MLLEVKKVDPIRRELKFQIGKERVTARLEEVYKELGKVAKIKGFRPGKAPRHLLESEHSHVAQEEVLKSLIPEAYQEAIEKEKLDPIDMPDINDVSFKDGVITFTAKLDIRPEVQVKDYKQINVKRKSSQVTDEEINKTLEYFKKGQGEKEVALDDTFARGLGYPSFDDFKKSLSRQLEMDKDRHNRLDIENQIVEDLLKHSKLMVPQSLVKKQLEHRMKETTNRLKSQGMSDEEIQKREEQMKKELTEAIDKDIKLYFIFAKIAELEKIEIAQNENIPAKVMEFLLKEAKWEEAK